MCPACSLCFDRGRIEMMPNIKFSLSRSPWQIYSTHFSQKFWPRQLVNQTKSIYKTVVRCDVTGRITLGTKLKYPFLPFTYPITHKVGFWYFESLRNKNNVSNKTYRYFRYRSLVRPGSKSPNSQGPHPISCNAKYSRRDNIYLVDLKSKITYQNIRWGTKVRAIFIP